MVQLATNVDAQEKGVGTVVVELVDAEEAHAGVMPTATASSAADATNMDCLIFMTSP